VITAPTVKNSSNVLDYNFHKAYSETIEIESSRNEMRDTMTKNRIRGLKGSKKC